MTALATTLVRVLSLCNMKFHGLKGLNVRKKNWYGNFLHSSKQSTKKTDNKKNLSYSLMKSKPTFPSQAKNQQQWFYVFLLTIKPS